MIDELNKTKKKLKEEIEFASFKLTQIPFLTSQNSTKQTKKAPTENSSVLLMSNAYKMITSVLPKDNRIVMIADSIYTLSQQVKQSK